MAVDLAWLPVCVRNTVCVLGERAINTSRNPLVFHPRCGSSVSLFNGFRSAHRPRLAFMLKFCGAFLTFGRSTRIFFCSSGGVKYYCILSFCNNIHKQRKAPDIVSLDMIYSFLIYKM